MKTPSTLTMTNLSAENASPAKAIGKNVTLKGFVFLLVLIAGVTAIAGQVAGNEGIWSAIIGGGLALSNYGAFMWISASE
jgi:hypothetical protein